MVANIPLFAGKVCLLFQLCMLLGFGKLKTLPSSQMCLSEFQTYTGSLLLKACLSQFVAPCRNLPALFVFTNWLLGDDL